MIGVAEAVQAVERVPVAHGPDVELEVVLRPDDEGPCLDRAVFFRHGEAWLLRGVGAVVGCFLGVLLGPEVVDFDGVFEGCGFWSLKGDVWFWLLVLNEYYTDCSECKREVCTVHISSEVTHCFTCHRKICLNCFQKGGLLCDDIAGLELVKRRHNSTDFYQP